MQEIKIKDDCEVTTANPELLCTSLGLPEDVPLYTALDQLFGGLIPVIPENQEKINIFLSFIMANNPTTLLEAQMVVQLLTCHRLCANMLRKSKRNGFPEVTEKYLNMGLKLSRNFKNGMETLSKVKRGGRQHISIEHVSVENDAQAIIGNVSKRGVI